MSRACLRFLVVSSLAGLSACASDSTGAGEVLVVSQVEVQPPGAGLILGATTQFTATPRTSSGIPVPNRQVTWSSANEAIATVSASGLVTAVGLGEVMITARVDGASGSRPVNVSPKPVAQVRVTPLTADLFVGGSVQLEVETLDAAGAPLPGRTILYASDNPAVATVSLTGLVTALTPGQTMIRVASEGKEATVGVTVTARPAVRLGYLTQPADGTAGQALGSIRVAVQDETGATVTGSTAPVTLALATNPGNATLSGTLTVNAADGVATFTTIMLDKSGTGYTLRATSGSLTGAVSTGFAITAGAPAGLAIVTQPPPTAPNGAPFNPQPVVQVQDAHGNSVAQAGIPVTATLVGTGATLGGTLTVNTNAGGAAAFINLSLGGQAGTYQIRFTAPNLTAVTSSNVSLTAARLSIVTQPSATASSGTALTQQPVLRLVDADGAPVAQAGIVITASVTPSGATLTPPASATTNASGIATFSGLTLTGKTGTYQLSFSGTGLTAVTSTPIVLGPGTPSQLALTTAPGPSGSSGVPLTPQPVVQIQDASGNPVALAGRTITASIATGPGNASLSGTGATTGDGGSAGFSGLAITGPLGSYTLRFQSAGLTEVVSGPVTLVSGSVSRIVIVTQPPNAVQNGQPWTATPAVRAEDASGNPVPGAAVTVFRSAGSTSGVLGGTLTQITGSDGQASYPGLTLTGPVGDYRIRWTAAGVNSSNSREITLTTGPAARLGIVTQPPGTVRNDQPFPTQPVIQVQDAGGNAVAQSGISIGAAIASGGGTLGGGPATTNNNGRATFSGLKITGVIGVRTLEFNATGLLPAVSGNINVLAGTATRIVIVTQPPASVVAGQVLVPNPVVDLEDVSGNNVDSAGVVITASSDGGLTGTANRSTGSNGQATWTDLGLTAPGTRALSFNRTGLQGAVSSSITVTPAGSMSVTQQPPASIGSGAAFSAGTTVLSGDGTPAAGVSVTVALISGAGSLTGSLTATTNASGVATFDNLVINGTAGGGYTLRFVSGILAVNSAAFNLSVGAPASIVITTQPSGNADDEKPFDRPPVVEVRDSGGNLVSGVTVTAVLVPQGLSAGTFICCDTAVTGANGRATFTGIGINRTGVLGDDYRIRFTIGTLQSALSNNIDID